MSRQQVVPLGLSSDGWPMVAFKHLPGKNLLEIEEKALPLSTYPFEDERLATERKLAKAVASALAAIQQAVFKKLDRESRSLKELIEEYGEKHLPGKHDQRSHGGKRFSSELSMDDPKIQGAIKSGKLQTASAGDAGLAQGEGKASTIYLAPDGTALMSKRTEIIGAHGKFAEDLGASSYDEINAQNLALHNKGWTRVAYTKNEGNYSIHSLDDADAVSALESHLRGVASSGMGSSTPIYVDVGDPFKPSISATFTLADVPHYELGKISFLIKRDVLRSRKAIQPIFAAALEEYGEKYNPYHDARGRFAKTGGGGGGRISGEWVHSTSPENARAILKDGIDVQRGQYGAFWTSRTSSAYGSGEVKIRLKTNKVVSSEDPRLKAVGQGLDNVRLAKARELGFQAIHVPMNDPGNDWLVILDHKAVEITGATVGGEAIKAKQKKTIAVWWEDWLEKHGAKALSDVPADQAFWDEQKAAFFEQAGPATQDALMAAAAQASSFGLAVDFDLVNQGVLEFTRTFGDEWWGRLEGTTREGLRAAIGANISTGAPLDTLKKSLEPLFGKTRADMIASTETTRLYAEGNAIGYRAAGVTQLEFRTAREFHVGKGGVCDRCREMDGEKFSIDDTGSRPPLHVRCRCFVVPCADGEALAVPGEFATFDPYSVEALGAVEEMEKAYLAMEEEINPGAIDWGRIGGDPRREAMKRSICNRLAERTGLPSDVIDQYLRSWAGSSSDDSMRSVAMQVAASKRYGIQMTDFVAKASKKFSNLPARYGVIPFDEAIAEANKVLVAAHEETQALLKAQGIKTVKLYRGMSWPDSDAPPEVLGFLERRGKEARAAGGHVKYTEELEFVSNPLSSWTIDPEVAARFSGGPWGVVFSVEAPIDAIISTPLSGVGCLNEYEFIVRGGTHKVLVASQDDFRALVGG